MLAQNAACALAEAHFRGTMGRYNRVPFKGYGGVLWGSLSTFSGFAGVFFHVKG